MNIAQNRQTNRFMDERKENNRQANNKKEEEKENIENRAERENTVFEIFGIKLYFDDILIISLILFLYNEGVRDNLLFISLILILMS